MSSDIKPPRRFNYLRQSGFVMPGAAQAQMLGMTGLGDVNPAYDGASFGRRLGFWGIRGTGPNADADLELHALRDRSRELVRNSPLAKAAEDTWVSELVGTGLVPRPTLDDKNAVEALLRLFKRWSRHADADGVLDFFGLQELAARSLFVNGEALGRLRPRRLSDGLAVPFQVQLLEPDHLDGLFGTASQLRAPNGNLIKMGIELNRIGKRVRYWLTQEHPGEMGVGSHQTVPVNARNVLHVYKPRRPGQLRGIPELTSIIVGLRELEQYNDAELVRKKVSALFAGFIENPDPEGGLLNADGETMEGNPVASLEPGILQELSPGQKVTFSNPADVGTTYEPWMKQQLRQLARGAGLTYELWTGDLTGVNYTSIRAGLLEFRRRLEVLQQNILAFQFCQPIWERFIDMALASGALAGLGLEGRLQELYEVDWIAPGHRYLDPVKEVRGDELAIKAGIDSREGATARRGTSVEQVDRQNRRAVDSAEDNDLVYTTNLGPAAAPSPNRDPANPSREPTGDGPPNNGDQNNGGTRAQGRRPAPRVRPARTRGEQALRTFLAEA